MLIIVLIDPFFGNQPYFSQFNKYIGIQYLSLLYFIKSSINSFSFNLPGLMYSLTLHSITKLQIKSR